MAMAVSTSIPAGELIEQAVIFHKAGNTAAAISLYRQVLKHHPLHDEACHLLGALLVECSTCVGGKPAAHMPHKLLCHECRAWLNNHQQQPPRKHKNPVVLQEHQANEGIQLLMKAISVKPSYGKYRRSLGVAYQRMGLPQQALEAFEFAVEKDPSDMVSLSRQAQLLKQVGRPGRAVEVYHHITQLKPDHPTAHLSVACLLRQLGRRAEAINAFRRHLDLAPDHEEARFWLAALTGDTSTAQAAPSHLVAGLFDSYAENFDNHLVGQLDYKTPWLLMDVLLQAVRSSSSHCCPPPWSRCVDLGCGTGLMGPLLAPHTIQLEGVDLSAGMIAKAKARGCYHKLSVADLVEYLARGSSSSNAQGYQAFVAADVFVYIGNLQPVLQAMATCSCTGAVLAFSTEAAACASGYSLAPTGRYSHSKQYLQDVLHENGWNSISLHESVIRHNAGKPVQGYLCVAVRI